MRDVPAEVRATWPDPDYDSPVRRGSTLIVVETCLVSLALLTLLARMYVRLVVVKACGPDDWIMVVAMAFTVGVTVCAILLDQLYGWNVHIWDLSIAEAVKGRQVSLAAQTLFLFSSGLPKVSILVTYSRIAPKSVWLLRATRFLIVWVTMIICIFFVVIWTQCTPMKAYWLVGGLQHCSPEGPPVLAQAVATVITDVVVVVLLLPIVLKLHLPRHQRVMLALLFSGGLIVVLASCQRAYWSYYVIEKTYDVTWEGFYLWVWTAVEANLGVICGNAPALRPLYGAVVARCSGRRIGSVASQETHHHSITESTDAPDCGGHGEVVDVKRAESWESYTDIERADAVV
ncbi:hypothetical protein EDB81DRAFT_905165 [Dactylonectria macrodidyma]|uniref:Rhodopsin domain-containing protein n=1 Tax=Dactylonectria macrodidyma TaxID=307937 RepID=A0A9P9E7P5_9HYPO|nr:hypothetical protein EDB81DRAFT_905165 [Dactylonectria macrodidyma]